MKDFSTDFLEQIGYLQSLSICNSSIQFNP